VKASTGTKDGRLKPRLPGGLASVLLIALSCVYVYVLYSSRHWSSSPRLYAWVVAGIGLLLSLQLLVIEGLRARTSGALSARESDQRSTGGDDDVDRAAEAGYMMWLGGVLAASLLIGFTVSFVLFAVLYLKTQGRKRWRPCLITGFAVIVTLAVMDSLGFELPDVGLYNAPALELF
jgi:hypothetical protein